MAQSSAARLGRAAAVGLSAGLILGSMYLTWQGAMHGKYDCAAEHVDSSECDFMVETTRQTALEQLAGAAGLAMVGAGLALWLRGKSEPAGQSPPTSD